jgi:DNA excision repair protein ERCC-4
MVIVDKREFNSSLPAKLYHEGFWVIPILLEKGDYILSNEICVERKSVETGDLLESLLSGRLEKQLLKMVATFKKCILLIEFSAKINFTIERAGEKKTKYAMKGKGNSSNSIFGMENDPDKEEGRSKNIGFLLAAITMKFPTVAILWSKSVESTCKFFKSIKEGKPEPDPMVFFKFQEELEKNSNKEVADLLVDSKIKADENMDENDILKELKLVDDSSKVVLNQDKEEDLEAEA